MQVHESQIEVRVERRLLVVVEPDRFRKMLDRLAEDPLLEADVADVDARQRIRRLFHQDLLKGRQGVVVVAVQHLRPAEQGFGLRLPRGQLERLVEGLNGAVVIPERNEAPSLLDERRRADVVRFHRGTDTGELGRGRLRGGRRLQLLVLVDQKADILFQLPHVGEQRVDLLEKEDDLLLDGVAFRLIAGLVEALRDTVVLSAQRRHRRVAHQADSFMAVASASFSRDASSFAVLSTMMVRASRPTRPVMYSAASPLTIAGGALTAAAPICMTSVTVSTTKPILPPSQSSTMMRVSSLSGASTPSRLRRSITGTGSP